MIAYSWLKELNLIPYQIKTMTVQQLKKHLNLTNDLYIVDKKGSVLLILQKNFILQDGVMCFFKYFDAEVTFGLFTSTGASMKSNYAHFASCLGVLGISPKGMVIYLYPIKLTCLLLTMLFFEFINVSFDKVEIIKYTVS